MGRHESITRYITKEKRGIEIGAWYNGVAPKRLGYNCLILDVFDTATLRSRAEKDPSVSPDMAINIEGVDLVGSSTLIAQLVEGIDALGQFDYIVASHNLEHTPDPITFFQGCERVLKPDGYLSMIVPDRRGCFDYFRPNSTTAELVAAYFEKRSRPSDAQVFEQHSLHARRVNGADQEIVFPFSTDPHEIIPFQHLDTELDYWKRRIHSGDDSYRDAHCWAFTPASFELVLLDLGFLGLTKFDVAEMESTDGEFFVHLHNSGRFSMSERDFYERRTHLLLRANDEASIAAPRVRKLESEIASSRETISRLEEQSNACRETISMLEEQSNLFRQEAQKAIEDLCAIRESTSWRLTSLLRAVSSGFRKVAR